MRHYFLIFLLLAASITVVFALTDKPREIGEITIIHQVQPEGQIVAMSVVEGPCYGADFWSDVSEGPMEYIINPTNPQGLDPNFIFQTYYDATQEWDDETSSDLFPDYIYVVDYIYGGTYDGYNVVSFGELDSQTIALTSFWYWVDTGEIVEWDMIFNTDFNWGDAEYESGVMDFEEIAVHELGHTLGLYDIYRPACNYVTMYGYSSYDETYKRDLAAPDIFILQQIYGGIDEGPLLTSFGQIKTRVNVGA